MKIYTKTGDSGDTSLFGGQRVPKSDMQVEAYGTVDELNSILALAVLEVKSEEIVSILHRLQSELFQVGSDLATPYEGTASVERVSKKLAAVMEEEIDKFQSELPELRNFILPGGSKGASYLHLGRVVCRRAERLTVHLKESRQINPNTVVYLNRLSDLLFVLARYENHLLGKEDVIWKG